MNQRGTVSCLVVSENPVIRTCLTELLGANPPLHCVGCAASLRIARDKIRRFRPAVIVHAFGDAPADDLAFLSNLMRLLPTPVLVLTTAGGKSAEFAVDSFAIGVQDVMEIPASHPENLLRRKEKHLIERLLRISHARVEKLLEMPKTLHCATSTESAGPKKFKADLIALGASTGGVESLGQVIRNIPRGLPPVCIVQHIPEGFSELFVERMDRVVKVDVRLAKDGQRSMPGTVYLAPGNVHLEILKLNGSYVQKLRQSPPENRHRPSVDVFFRSVARHAGASALVGLMTGMGADGARGLLECRQKGAHTFAQDEETSLVFGMPRAAIELGAAEHVVALHEIPKHIRKMVYA